MYELFFPFSQFFSPFYKQRLIKQIESVFQPISYDLGRFSKGLRKFLEIDAEVEILIASNPWLIRTCFILHLFKITTDG